MKLNTLALITPYTTDHYFTNLLCCPLSYLICAVLCRLNFATLANPSIITTTTIRITTTEIARTTPFDLDVDQEVTHGAHLPAVSSNNSSTAVLTLWLIPQYTTIILPGIILCPVSTRRIISGSFICSPQHWKNVQCVLLLKLISKSWR